MKIKRRADGRYQISVYLGKDPDGREQRKVVYGETIKDTEAKAAAVKARIGKGLDLTSGATFAEWAEIWYDNKKLSVGESSRGIYRAVIDRADQYIGRMKLRDVLPIQLQRIVDDLAQNNPSTGRPASARLIGYQIQGMRQIFDYARKNRLVDVNPATELIAPKNTEIRRREPITEEERELILRTDHRMKPAAMIMLYAGLRRGEVLPLTWADVDLEDGTISVNKAVEMIKRKPHVKAPKTKSGIRTVYIPDALRGYLRELERTGELVFPDKSGRMWTGDEFRRGWESYMADLSAAKDGVNKYSPKFVRTVSFTPHQLRHTFCTDMYAAGVDVLTAKEQMGHSSINVTLEIYTHLSSERSREEMKKLNSLS